MTTPAITALAHCLPGWTVTPTAAVGDEAQATKGDWRFTLASPSPGIWHCIAYLKGPAGGEIEAMGAESNLPVVAVAHCLDDAQTIARYWAAALEIAE